MSESDKELQSRNDEFDDARKPRRAYLPLLLLPVFSLSAQLDSVEPSRCGVVRQHDGRGDARLSEPRRRAGAAACSRHGRCDAARRRPLAENRRGRVYVRGGCGHDAGRLPASRAERECVRRLRDARRLPAAAQPRRRRRLHLHTRPARRDFRAKQQLLGVPTDARYHATLRVYGNSYFPVSLRVRVYREGESTPVAEQSVQTNGIIHIEAPELPSDPSYAQLDPLTDAVRAAGPRVRVEVASESSEKLWAMLSITNNETQQVTLITPHR